MYRERLIVSVVIALVYCFAMYPIPAIVISVVAIAGYFLLRRGNENAGINRGRRTRREEALKKAAIYLGYYNDMWRNLRLSNDRCYLSLASDGYSIRGFEKNVDLPVLRSFKVVRSNVHDLEEVWNMFCMAFRYNTTYDMLKEHCRRFELIIEEQVVQKEGENNSNDIGSALQAESVPAKLLPEKIVDVNNCQEAELVDLPGISVVMAKKTVKRREEIGGFKTSDEFFKFLNIKPNMQDQLKDLICFNEIKSWKKVERFNERNVDL